MIEVYYMAEVEHCPTDLPEGDWVGSFPTVEQAQIAVERYSAALTDPVGIVRGVMVDEDEGIDEVFEYWEWRTGTGWEKG